MDFKLEVIDDIRAARGEPAGPDGNERVRQEITTRLPGR
jgi:hypothetical protein